MKKIAILLTVGFLAAAPWSALAGGHGYSGHGGGYYHGHGGYGAGAFFAGLFGGAILTTVIANTLPAVAYVPPPPEQVWVPGRYVVRVERQWIPGHWERQRARMRWQDPRWELRGGVYVFVAGCWR